MSSLEIIFLGTGAGLSTKRAHTAIALRCPDGTLLLLDGSSGNSALRHGEIAGIKSYDYDHVLLSHDHQDHLSGLMFVQGNRSREIADENPLSIYGSSLALEGLRKATVAAKVPDIRDGAAYNHSGKQVMRWEETQRQHKLEARSADRGLEFRRRPYTGVNRLAGRVLRYFSGLFRGYHLQPRAGGGRAGR